MHIRWYIAAEHVPLRAKNCLRIITPNFHCLASSLLHVNHDLELGMVAMGTRQVVQIYTRTCLSEVLPIGLPEYAHGYEIHSYIYPRGYKIPMGNPHPHTYPL